MNRILPTIGLVRLVLLLLLIIPTGYGYSVYTDYSGRLVTEQLYQGKLSKTKGASFHTFREIFNNRAKNKATYGFQLANSNQNYSTAFAQQFFVFDTFKNELQVSFYIQPFYADDEFGFLM